MHPLTPETPESNTESSLLLHAKAGDSEAFDQLYRRNFDSLRNYLRLKFSDYNSQDAEDIAQEALVRTWLRLEAVENFGSYVCSAAINLGYSEHRRRDHPAQPHLAGAEYERQLHSLVDTAPSPEDIIVDRETVRRLGGTLLERQPVQAPIIFAIGYAGFTHAEAAEQFKVDPATSKSRYSRGVRTAQQWRDEMIGDEEAS